MASTRSLSEVSRRSLLYSREGAFRDPGLYQLFDSGPGLKPHERFAPDLPQRASAMRRPADTIASAACDSAWLRGWDSNPQPTD